MALLVIENRVILKDAAGRQVIVPEKSSGPLITLTLLDEVGAPVPLAAIGTATLTIYARDEATLPIVNAVDHVNIKNANQGTIHATTGLLTLLLAAADNTILNATNDLEWHRLLIEISYSGSKALKQEIDLPVRNLNKVT
jgi:hypothetical protein